MIPRRKACSSIIVVACTKRILYAVLFFGSPVHRGRVPLPTFPLSPTSIILIKWKKKKKPRKKCRCRRVGNSCVYTYARGPITIVFPKNIFFFPPDVLRNASFLLYVYSSTCVYSSRPCNILLYYIILLVFHNDMLDNQRIFFCVRIRILAVICLYINFGEVFLNV